MSNFTKVSRDWLTRKDAEVQAALIQAHWWQKGWRVEVMLEPFKLYPEIGRESLYCIRSDMVNGWPRRRVAR